VQFQLSCGSYKEGIPVLSQGPQLLPGERGRERDRERERKREKERKRERKETHCQRDTGKKMVFGVCLCVCVRERERETGKVFVAVVCFCSPTSHHLSRLTHRNTHMYIDTSA